MRFHEGTKRSQIRFRRFQERFRESQRAPGGLRNWVSDKPVRRLYFDRRRRKGYFWQAVAALWESRMKRRDRNLTMKSTLGK